MSCWLLNPHIHVANYRLCLISCNVLRGGKCDHCINRSLLLSETFFGRLAHAHTSHTHNIGNKTESAASHRAYISSSSVICHTTGPQPLSKRFLHLMRSRASSFKWQYPLLSPRSSSNFLRLLPRLLVTYIRPFFFPSITSFRRQFLRKIWPIQLAFRFLISCRIQYL
jgi:hypothetical protein